MPCPTWMTRADLVKNDAPAENNRSRYITRASPRPAAQSELLRPWTARGDGSLSRRSSCRRVRREAALPLFSLTPGPPSPAVLPLSTGPGGLDRRCQLPYSSGGCICLPHFCVRFERRRHGTTRFLSVFSASPLHEAAESTCADSIIISLFTQL